MVPRILQTIVLLGLSTLLVAHAFVISPFQKESPRRGIRLSITTTPSILLVDDEEGIRTAVGTLLEDNGYMVEMCEDATTALQKIQEKPNSYDCVVSDVRMPGPSGLDFVQSLRQMGLTSLPIILLTAAGQPNDRIAGYQAGADAYLPKPFAPEELLAIIGRLIHRSVSMMDLHSELATIQESLRQQANSVFLAADETKVLEYVAQGWTTKEIAAAMFLSTRRIDQLLTNLFQKTMAKNRTELVRWAIAQGKVKV